MKEVYLLWHWYPDEPDEENAKLLGVYSSKEIAQLRITDTYNSLPGFDRGNSGDSLLNSRAIEFGS